MSIQQPEEIPSKSAAARINRLESVGVVADGETIPGCSDALTAQKTPVDTDRIDRGPFDITFAGGVSLALWAVIIFTLAVLF